MKLGIVNILDDQSWAPEETGLISALSSGDTEPSKSHILFRTGKWLAVQLGLEFLTPLLTKSSHQSLHTLGGAAERDAAVEGKYACQKFEGLKNVIIVDDLVTRGATFKEVARAVHAASGIQSFAALALGKNENRSYAERCGAELNNDHVSEKMESLWRSAEERFK